MVVLLTKRDIRKTVGRLKKMKNKGLPINLTNFTELYRFLLYARKCRKFNFAELLKDNYNNFAEVPVSGPEEAEKEVAYICYYLEWYLNITW